MIIAYIAWPPDNDTYMWDDPKTRGVPPPGVICTVCGQRIDYNAINPNYRPPRSYYDLSSVYDGDILVSPKLRSFLEERKLPGLRFVEIPSSKRYFFLQTSNVLKLIPPSSAKREEFCSACNQHRSVWGNQPNRARYEGVEEPIRTGVFFSDIKVGYYPQMGPLLIIGVDTWQAMLAAKFKGLGNGKPIVN